MPTALVIDDNRQTADSLCLLLSLLNVTATAAYGPREALLVLRAASQSGSLPDIVFLDLNMPGLSGFEVLAYLRREPDLLHIPVVVVTADDDRATARQAIREGARALIVKPASVDSIEAALKDAHIV